MSFLSHDELTSMNFKSLGKNVKISRDARFYLPETISIGDNSRIDDFCVLAGNITIGRNVHIAIFCNVSGGEKGIIMHDFCGLAYGCHVFTQTEAYSGGGMTNPTIPDEYKSIRKEAIIMKKHALVGTASLIFPGVTLEEGSSVGAMSMVTKSTEAWTVYAGIPAKAVKKRSQEALKYEEEFLKKYG